MVALAALLAACACLGVLFLAWRAGRKEERLTKEEEINRAVRKAALARERLRSDRDYALRVREKFTR